MTHHSTVALPGNPDMSQYNTVNLKMISRSINYIIIRFHVGLLWKYTPVVKLRKNMACLEQTVRVYRLWNRATAGACNRFVPDPRDRFVMLGEGWHSRSACIQSLDVMVSSFSISMDGPTDGDMTTVGRVLSADMPTSTGAGYTEKTSLLQSIFE
jgi:hypothetical protein